jgi:hypothetical protein
MPALEKWLDGLESPPGVEGEREAAEQSEISTWGRVGS